MTWFVLCRVVQYISKLLGWGLAELNASPEYIEKLAKLESHASTGRKCKCSFLTTILFPQQNL